MKKILFVSFFLLVEQFSFAQPGILKGIVLDAKSKEEIDGANIFLQSDKTRGTTSDESGNFSLSLPEGNQTVICSYIGYVTDTFTVVIANGKITTYNIILVVEAQELSTLVVSAGKYEQRLEEVTVSMEVLKPKLIEEKNTTNIAQVLEQVPGLNILDEEPQIRGGSGFSFGVGSRVAIMIDGIPILSGDVGKPDWSFIPIENLEQIEVIKGASSVMYGSSALSGTINFLTTYPTQPHRTKIRIYSGIYSPPENAGAKWWSGIANYSGFTLNQSWKTNLFDITIGGDLMYDHNFIGPPVADPNIPIEVDSLSDKEVADRSGRFDFNLRYRPKNDEGLSLGMNGNFMMEHSNFSLVWGDDSSKIYRAFPGALTLSDEFKFYLDPFLTYYSASGLQHHIRSRVFFDNSNSTNSQSTESKVCYLEYQVAKDLSKIEGLHFTSGMLTNQTFAHAELFSASGSPDNRLQNYAVYLQLDKKFRSVLNISAGFRGEYFQINKTENAVKPILRAGANLKLAQATFLRFSYGQGFRYPTVAEKFIRTSVGGITIYPNPDLQPETSWNTEIGIKQGLKVGKLFGSFDVAAFWQEYFNTIEYNYASWSPDSAGFKFVNVGDTRVRGLDVSLIVDGKIMRDLELSILAGYTYTLPQSVNPDYVYAVEHPGEGFIPKQLSYVSTSTDTTDYILKYRFQHIAKIDAELSYKPVALGFSVRYYSNMQNIDKTFYDLDHSYALPTGVTEYRQIHDNGWWVSDARMSCKLAKHYRASLVVSNLFNLEYALRPVKIESPRTIALQLRLEI